MRLVLWRVLNSLSLKIPIIEYTNAKVEVGRESQPSKVWRQAPRSHSVNLRPHVGKISDSSAQSQDIDGSGLWLLQAEEEGHPEVVEAKLDGVEGCAMFGVLQAGGGGQWVQAGCEGAVGGVAHEAVEEGPGWSK